MSRTIRYAALPEDDGKPVKRLLRGAMGLSHHQFSLLKAREGVLVDGVPVHANHIVRAGQRIEVTFEDEAGAQRVEPDAHPVRVVYEDEDLLLIDKDAPLACQSSSRQPSNTLENRLAARYGPDFVFRPVNRLDKGTSGLMTVAKHAHAQMLLSRQLHTDAFVREYLAVLRGSPPLDAGVVDWPIGKADGATIRREVRPDGRPCATEYEVIGRANGLSLTRLRLRTGRTHQIRVHMARLGCPVFGDFLYGEESPLLPGRFALHSARISLVQPTTGERVERASPLPDELRALLGDCVNGGS